MASTFEIGDSVTLTWAVADAEGTPSNATVTLTVTLPDGTSSTPTVSNPSTGSYAASLTPTLNGLHGYRWVATGAVTAAESGTFAVGGILTLDEAKKQLNKTSSADDDELQVYIDAATAIVEDYCGTVVSRTVSEWHAPSGSVIVLNEPHVVSVTSISDYYGGTATELTTDEYLLDPSLNGLVTKLSSGVPVNFAPRVLVTYVAGMSPVPRAINLAARIIVQHLWRTQNGGAGLPSVLDEDVDTVETSSGYAVPNRALELLRPYRRGPSIG